jgi:hypothetical protein
MLDLLPDVEHQMLGVRILPLFAIDETAQAQPLCGDRPLHRL